MSFQNPSPPAGSGPDPRKTFIVGDVHGCYEEFLSLMSKINYKKADFRLIFVGDLINRGPHSLKMLKWLKTEGSEAVRGNHEQAFLNGIRQRIPMSQPLERLKADMGDELEEWAGWIGAWPFFIEGEDFFVVHAGLVPGEHPKDSSPHLLMNIRTWDGLGEDLKSAGNPPWHKLYKGEKLAVYGHWARQGLKARKNSIGLDSGCVYGGRLSGVLLPERQIIQVPARKSYCPL